MLARRQPGSYVVTSSLPAAICRWVQPAFNRNNRYNDGNFYVQDSWKVTPRLTLNLGVRWEYYGVQHNANPALDSNFYLGSGADTVRPGAQWHRADRQPESGGRTVGAGQEQLGAARRLCL